MFLLIFFFFDFLSDHIKKNESLNKISILRSIGKIS